MFGPRSVTNVSRAPPVRDRMEPDWLLPMVRVYVVIVMYVCNDDDQGLCVGSRQGLNYIICTQKMPMN